LRSAKWQISTDGGYAPVWSRDKQELFYRSADRTMVVDVRTRPEFGSPRVLFEARYPTSTTGVWLRRVPRRPPIPSTAATRTGAGRHAS